jgi:hypothetical protein
LRLYGYDDNLHLHIPPFLLQHKENNKAALLPLSSGTISFLTSLLELFDVDKDGILTESGVLAIFAILPINEELPPWHPNGSHEVVVTMDSDEEAGTTLADQVSDDAGNGGTSSTGSIVVGTTEKNVEQQEQEQLYSKVSGEERVSVAWSKDTFTGGNSVQTKDEQNSHQNMPQSIAEAHQNTQEP